MLCAVFHDVTNTGLRSWSTTAPAGAFAAVTDIAARYRSADKAVLCLNPSSLSDRLCGATEPAGTMIPVGIAKAGSARTAF
eukprot:2017337-Pyramimonas_sp.AAC.1